MQSEWLENATVDVELPAELHTAGFRCSLPTSPFLRDSYLTENCVPHELVQASANTHRLAQSHIHGHGRPHQAVDLLELPESVLGKLWPAGRVVMGISTCKRLRDCLRLHVRRVALQVVPGCAPTSVDILQFQQSELELTWRQSDANRTSELSSALAPALHAGLAQRLRLLDVAQDKLSSEGMSVACMSQLCGCTALTHLNLQDHGLSADDGTFHFLSVLTALEHLNLQGNHLSAASGVFSTLQRLTRLTQLNLSQSSIPHTDLQAVGDAIGSCTNLETLKLDKAWSWGPRDGLTALAALPRLLSLSLAGNKFGDGMVPDLMVVLEHCTALQQLDLSSVGITVGIIELSEVLPSCQQLSTLLLSLNHFNSAAGLTLGDRLPLMPALRHLEMKGNVMMADGLAAITDCLPHCPRLEVLDLGGSGPLSLRTIQGAVEQIVRCSALTALTLYSSGHPQHAIAAVNERAAELWQERGLEPRAVMCWRACLGLDHERRGLQGHGL